MIHYGVVVSGELESLLLLRIIGMTVQQIVYDFHVQFPTLQRSPLGGKYSRSWICVQW
jgi:hypothetical protein